jgi:hypothetical protein
MPIAAVYVKALFAERNQLQGQKMICLWSHSFFLIFFGFGLFRLGTEYI